MTVPATTQATTATSTAGEKQAKKGIKDNMNWRWYRKHIRMMYHHPDNIPRTGEVPFGRIWRAVLAEFFAVILFVFFATGAATVAVIVNPEKDGAAIVIVALGQAFALVISVFSVGNVSGAHLNPAITLAVFVVRRMKLWVALSYIVAQIGGAIIGSLLLKAVIPRHLEGDLGATTLAPGYDQGTALLLEAIMTFALAWVIWATAIDPDGFGKLAPLAIGLVLIVDLIIGWLFTGASMNPARSLGPAIVANQWDDHWVFWAGPIIGALLAALIYDFVLMSRPPNPSPEAQGTRIESQKPEDIYGRQNDSCGNRVPHRPETVMQQPQQHQPLPQLHQQHLPPAGTKMTNVPIH